MPRSTSSTHHVCCEPLSEPCHLVKFCPADRRVLRQGDVTCQVNQSSAMQGKTCGSAQDSGQFHSHVPAGWRHGSVRFYCPELAGPPKKGAKPTVSDTSSHGLGPRRPQSSARSTAQATSSTRPRRRSSRSSATILLLPHHEKR